MKWVVEVGHSHVGVGISDPVASPTTRSAIEVDKRMPECYIVGLYTTQESGE